MMVRIGAVRHDIFLMSHEPPFPPPPQDISQYRLPKWHYRQTTSCRLNSVVMGNTDTFVRDSKNYIENCRGIIFLGIAFQLHKGMFSE